MIKQSGRLFTAIYGFLGVFQGSLSYGFYFFPTLDQGLKLSDFPANQTHTPHTTGLVPVPSGAHPGAS